MPRGKYVRTAKHRKQRPFVERLETVLTSFWSNVARKEPEHCWAWTGRVGQSNRAWQRYGQFAIYSDGRTVNFRAHRLAWLLLNGPIPEGMNVLHRCDNTNCVNPNHLFVGTQKENVEDQRTKGRLWYGQRNGRAKLTEQDVLDIRASAESDSELGRKYGVYATTVRDARMGKKWPHLPGATRRVVPRKLTPEQVREIRRRREAGERTSDIAKSYGISQPMASQVARGQAYRHVV